MANSDFTGVILAGGKSRRMGNDKAQLVTPQGLSLLATMENILEAAGATNTVVLGRADICNGEADKYPFAGPAKAVTCYLDKQKFGSKHIIVPIDMPNLKPSLLKLLLQTEDWAYFSDFFMPFMAVAGSQPLNSISRIRELLSYHNAKKISVPYEHKGAFLNLNYPEEFAIWHQRNLTQQAYTETIGNM